jgi:hypothetical protein
MRTEQDVARIVTELRGRIALLFPFYRNIEREGVRISA